MKTKIVIFSVVVLISITIFIFFSTRSESKENIKVSLPPNDSSYTELDRYLKTEETRGFMGSVFVVRNGKIIIHKSYGQKDTTLHLAYWIASNTKTVTAMAILKLVENKMLSIEDSLKKHFTDVPPDKQHITIHT